MRPQQEGQKRKSRSFVKKGEGGKAGRFPGKGTKEKGSFEMIARRALKSTSGGGKVELSRKRDSPERKGSEG